MAIDTLNGDTVPIKLWTKVSDVEEGAQKQLKNIASLPWCFSHVAVMPDVHFGRGATIGSVIAMKDAIAPSAVGVDIGCGMSAVRTSLTANDLPDDLRRIRDEIEQMIPVGFFWHEGSYQDKLADDVALNAKADALFNEFRGLVDEVQEERPNAVRQLGSLGGGNHFIELCLDEVDRVWMMLHSGSRGIGNKLASYHIEKAMTLAHNQTLPDRELAVFIAGTPQMEAYRRDLFWAQRFAALNREVMLALYQRVVEKHFRRAKPTFDAPINCHHNYVAEEVHFGEQVLITRKGAIRAGVGDMGIIPGSMGQKSYIVRGRGNPEAFESASHGAGRKMSRGQAKRTFTVHDLEKLTEGVECRKDESVLDEIPSAYKDIDAVMENQKDLVEVMHQLRGVICVKGGDERRPHSGDKRPGDKRHKTQRGGKRE